MKTEGISATSYKLAAGWGDAFGWDWFLETTIEGKLKTVTAVIITYNTNKKDMWSPKFGKVVDFIAVTKVITEQADGTVTTNHVPYSPTSLMKEIVQDA